MKTNGFKMSYAVLQTAGAEMLTQAMQAGRKLFINYFSILVPVHEVLDKGGDMHLCTHDDSYESEECERETKLDLLRKYRIKVRENREGCYVISRRELLKKGGKLVFLTPKQIEENGKWNNHPHNWLYQTNERAIKFFENLGFKTYITCFGSDWVYDEDNRFYMTAIAIKDTGMSGVGFSKFLAFHGLGGRRKYQF